MSAVVSPAPDRKRLRAQLENLTDEELILAQAELRWKRLARKKQLPPEEDWNFYGVKSGRGFGKTLCAAQWTFRKAARNPRSIWFVIAPTHEDLMRVCFQGPTGLLGSYEDKKGDIGPPGTFYPVIPPQLIKSYIKAPYPVITLWNDAIICGFSADTPNRLRGPQCWGAWCDEIASWRYPDEAWDNLIMGLRLGKKPQVFWTGTPKPKPFIRKLIKLAKSIVVSGSTYENEANLAPTFFENVAKYEGTAVGRQELWGEILDPEEAGFVKRSQWRIWPRERPLPKFRFIIMSLDTALTEKQWDKKEQVNDPTACTVWGLFTYERTDHVMLLDAWEDYLGMPQLIRRVKLERTLTYGDADEPVLKRAILDKGRRAGHTGRPPDLILVENKVSGISLRQCLAVENVLTEGYDPGDLDKLSRLHATSLLYPHGRVWAIETGITDEEGRPIRGEHGERLPRKWAEPVISQVCTYVGEGSLEHDDLLDTTTQAHLFLMRKFDMKFTVQTDPLEAAKQVLERIRREQRRNPYDG